VAHGCVAWIAFTGILPEAPRKRNGNVLQSQAKDPIEGLDRQRGSAAEGEMMEATSPALYRRLELGTAECGMWPGSQWDARSCSEGSARRRHSVPEGKQTVVKLDEGSKSTLFSFLATHLVHSSSTTMGRKKIEIQPITVCPRFSSLTPYSRPQSSLQHPQFYPVAIFLPLHFQIRNYY